MKKRLDFCRGYSHGGNPAVQEGEKLSVQVLPRTAVTALIGDDPASPLAQMALNLTIAQRIGKKSRVHSSLKIPFSWCSKAISVIGQVRPGRQMVSGQINNET
jgi:hypothetical protein